jgi:hypothetical protein
LNVYAAITVNKKKSKLIKMTGKDYKLIGNPIVVRRKFMKSVITVTLNSDKKYKVTNTAQLNKKIRDGVGLFSDCNLIFRNGEYYNNYYFYLEFKANSRIVFPYLPLYLIFLFFPMEPTINYVTREEGGGLQFVTKPYI